MDNEMNVEEKTPLLSVIVPTYNRKEMLSDALKGILSQSLRDIEVIVVDDCSSDGTQDFMNSISDERVRYFRNENNAGPEINRIFGLNQARGKYVVFHDDDDYYTDYEFFEKALKIFAENAESEMPLAIVCADGEVFYTETGQVTPHNSSNPGRVNGVEFVLKQEREYFKPTSLFPAVFNAEILRHSGLGDMKIYDSETYFWVALHGDVYIISDIVGVYRLHPHSNTLGREKSSEWTMKRMQNLAGRIRIDNMIFYKLCERSDEKSAKRWYVEMVETQFQFFMLNGNGFANALSIYKTILSEANFMPELKYILLWAWVTWIPRRILRKFEPLRKFYRRIKYGNKV